MTSGYDFSNGIGDGSFCCFCDLRPGWELIRESGQAGDIKNVAERRGSFWGRKGIFSQDVAGFT